MLCVAVTKPCHASSMALSVMFSSSRSRMRTLELVSYVRVSEDQGQDQAMQDATSCTTHEHVGHEGLDSRPFAHRAHHAHLLLHLVNFFLEAQDELFLSLPEALLCSAVLFLVPTTICGEAAANVLPL